MIARVTQSGQPYSTYIIMTFFSDKETELLNSSRYGVLVLHPARERLLPKLQLRTRGPLPTHHTRREARTSASGRLEPARAAPRRGARSSHRSHDWRLAGAGQVHGHPLHLHAVGYGGALRLHIEV